MKGRFFVGLLCAAVIQAPALSFGQYFETGTVDGQNGWSNYDPANVVEAVTGVAARTGDQSWHMASGGGSGYAAMMGSASVPGGAGETGANGNPVADSFSTEFWFRTADSTSGANTSFSTSSSDPAARRNTYFSVSATDSGVTPSVYDYAGGNYVQTVSPTTLEWGEWYRVTIDATFVDGAANDLVLYEVFDSVGDSLWSIEIGSWEESYSGYLMNSSLQSFNRGSTGNGFYIDDFTISTWDSSNPGVILSSYSTSFEAVPEPGVAGLVALGLVLTAIRRRRR